MKVGALHLPCIRGGMPPYIYLVLGVVCLRVSVDSSIHLCLVRIEFRCTIISHKLLIYYVFCCARCCSLLCICLLTIRDHSGPFANTFPVRSFHFCVRTFRFVDWFALLFFTIDPPQSVQVPEHELRLSAVETSLASIEKILKAVLYNQTQSSASLDTEPGIDNPALGVSAGVGGWLPIQAPSFFCYYYYYYQFLYRWLQEKYYS